MSSEVERALVPPAPGGADLAAQLFEAFNRRDVDAAVALVHPEIVFSPVTAEVLHGGKPYVGHEGLRQYMADIDAHFGALTVDPGHIREAGRAVVALGTVRGQGPAARLESTATWVFRLRDGLVSQIQVFADEKQARRALGRG